MVVMEMLLKEKRSLDDDENGLYVKNIDEDGVKICEKCSDEGVYVYYSEIPLLVDLLSKYKEECNDKLL